MKKKLKKKGLLLLTLVVFLPLANVTYAKFIKQVSVTSEVTFAVSLAENVELLETKAIRKNDGSYTFSTEEVTSNEYMVMPGVNIPKNPHFLITNKTDLEAYLFVEIKADTVLGISYNTTADWLDLGIIGPNNGEVYAYKTLLDGTQTDAEKIYILNNNEIVVSDAYNPECDFSMNIYGYMLQKIDAESDIDTFERCFGGD